MTANNHHNLEIEIKFLVHNLASIRQQLLVLGANTKKTRVYERNIRYDNDWDGLKLQKKLLRLRQDTKARITYKGEPDQQIDSEVRVLEELEIEVGNFITAAAILERIGFKRKQVYEKYRETFELGLVEIVLDEMPFGNFVELEGEEIPIREVANKLGLNWNKRILINYLTIMDRLKNERGLPFDDLTFDNFANSQISASSILDFGG